MSILILELLDYFICIKGVFLGLGYIFATESPLKMMKNAFYFSPKPLFVLKIFEFLPLLFCCVAKRLD